MHWSTKYICAAFSLFRPIAGTEFAPRDIAAGEAIAPRACDAAAPDVSQSTIIDEVCNQTLAGGYPTCSDQMTDYIQQSATNTCGRYSSLFTDCLMANDDDHTACADSLFGYQDCHNYTMQAYAYCGCYYSLPASLAECANEQLQPQSQDIKTLPPTSAPVSAVPASSDMLASAASADKEPTPAILPVSPGAASPSSQSTVTFSDPRIPNTPRIRTFSLKGATPYTNLSTTWTPNATPSTTPEPITIVVTHTTTITAAGYTTTATLTPAPIITTVYTCPKDHSSNNDVSTLPTPPSPAPAPAPIALAPLPPEPSPPHPTPAPAPSTDATKTPNAPLTASAPNSRSPDPSSPSSPSASVAAQRPDPGIAEWSTGLVNGSRETALPSPSGATTAVALGTGPSEGTMGWNGSVVCGRCRGRSRIL